MARILIVHASVGGGHRSAATAVAEAAARGHDVVIADYNDLVPRWQRAPVQAVYRLALGHAPGLWRSYYRRTNTAAPTLAARALASAGVERTAALLDRVAPDLVISTFTGAAALVGAAHRGVPHVAVATDYLPHRHWVRDGVDRWCVPSIDARAELIRLGAPDDAIVVTGFPVRRAVTSIDPTITRAELAARLELDDRPIVVVAAGAEPTARARRIVDALAGLRHPAQLLVCFDAPMPRRQRHLRFIPIGLTREFPRLIAAADLLVGKCGGATVAEVCTVGCPLVVVDPYPGQEEDNAAWLAAHGAAEHAGLDDLSIHVDALLQSPRRLDALGAAAHRLARPGAADAVVDHALDLLDGSRRPAGVAGTPASPP